MATNFRAEHDQIEGTGSFWRVVILADPKGSVIFDAVWAQ